MNYNIPAKETIYNGRKFRSRLEAKWQSMFNKMGWAAEYEPSQINGWNPDFIIKCQSRAYPTNSMIVEVKPSVFINSEYINSVYEKYKNVQSHILILSDTPFYRDKHGYGCVIGIGSQFFGDPSTLRSDMIEIDMKDYDEIGSEFMIFDGMIYGEIERKTFIRPQNTDFMKNIHLMWSDAGNEVMFKVKKNG